MTGSMEGYGPATYGDRIAHVYDELYGDLFDNEGAVETLASLAGEGPALELGIGTGRLALPLAARGVEVTGVDSSDEMVQRLRAKPGGADIDVVMGDFSEASVDGEFRLVFLVFNTIFGLLTQDAQIRCFANAARHLTEDGVFVIEAFVPDLTRFDRDQRVQTDLVHSRSVRLTVDLHDPANQRVDSSHVFLSEEGNRFYPVSIRYAFPAELDLMARLTGLRLRRRWANWRKAPFSSDSSGHVSVYERDHL